MKYNTKMPNSMMEAIASNVLGIETLKTRHNDDLDFHDVAVWSIVLALEMAYKNGYETACKNKET